MHIGGEQAEKTFVQVGHLLSTGEQSLKYWNCSTECQLWQVCNCTEYKIFFFSYQALSEIV